MSVGPPQPGESQQRVPSMVPGQQTGYQPSPAQPQPYQAPGQQVVYMQAPVNKPPRPPIRLTLDFGFLCTQIGVFKLIEFVTIILALSCVMHYKEWNTTPDGRRMDENSDVSFFSGSLISAWVMVILVSFGFIAGLHNACSAPQNFHIMVTLLHALWALLLVVSSGLMADQASDWIEKIDRWGTPFNRLQEDLRVRLILLFVAVGFGFISFIFLVLNAVLHLRIYSALKQQPYAGGMQPPVMQQHPGIQNPMMQPHPGIQNPMMQPHPGMQQPMMQPHPGTQQPVMQPHPGTQQPVLQ